MARIDRLRARLFKSEEELSEFLENCKDESWKNELIEYYSIDTPIEEPVVEDTEPTPEVIDEPTEETPVEEPTEEVVEEPETIENEEEEEDND